MSTRACKESVDRTEVQHLEFFAALDSAPETAGGEHGSKVEQGAGERGDRDAVANCAIVGGESGMMELNVGLGVAPRGRRDMERAGPAPKQSPDPSCGGVAGKSRRASQDRRKTVAVPGEIPMTYARAPCGRSLYPIRLQGTTAGQFSPYRERISSL